MATLSLALMDKFFDFFGRRVGRKARPLDELKWEKRQNAFPLP